MELSEKAGGRFLPRINLTDWEGIKQQLENPEEFFSQLAEPVHEELYRRQSFEFIYELTEGQQAVILLDYVRTQVMQGGFIQLIQNGYVGLLVPLIEALQRILPHTPIILSMDNALKVYVLNRETLDRQTSVEEFAKLYEEFREFEELDNDFARHLPEAIEMLNSYAIENSDTFFQIHQN